MMPVYHTWQRGGALPFMQGAPGGDPAGGSFIGLLVPMALIFVIFYFLLIRPANKKQKALQAMIENLKSGDKVITTGGILGVVAGISDEVIHLRIAPNIKIEVARNAIAALQKNGQDKEQA